MENNLFFNEKDKITRKIFSVLTVDFKSTDSIENTIKSILNFYGIKRENLYSIDITWFPNKNTSVIIEYSNYDLKTFTEGKNEEEQIISVLKALDYKDTDILSIQKEYAKGTTTNKWVVNIDGEYYPDETLSCRSQEMFIASTIRKAIDLKVYVNIF